GTSLSCACTKVRAARYPEGTVNKLFRSVAFYVVLALLLLLLVSGFFKGGAERQKISLDRVTALIADHQVTKAEILDKDHIVRLDTRAGEKYTAHYPDRYTDR